MREIYDTEQIECWLERESIREYFDTPDLVFRGFCYEKGEYLASPDKCMNEILFLIEGTVQVYGLREDGTAFPVDQSCGPVMMGDLEFTNQGFSPFYAEAKTNVICLSLSVKRYREQLECDVRFLHLLLKSYSDKLNLFSTVDLPSACIEERVLLYMQNMCPCWELDGVESAVPKFHCSRRQLQRVLKKLCEEGKIEKTGKGKYRLVREK